MRPRRTMAHKKSIIPVEAIERRILLIRRQKVMLDSDLAQLYGVSTKRLNERVKRNRKRFPSDFMFQLSEQEKSEVVANCDHLKNLKFSPVLPRAFTEHGAIMLASILNSSTAVEVRFLPVKCSTKQLEQRFSRQDATETKSEIRMSKSETNPATRIRITNSQIRNGLV